MVYPDQSQEDSHIEFSDVACHHLTHTSSAILTDIREEPLPEFKTREQAFLSASARSQGLQLWEKDGEQYLQSLQKDGYLVWCLVSAIGFSGFIVAKNVREMGLQAST